MLSYEEALATSATYSKKIIRYCIISELLKDEKIVHDYFYYDNKTSKEILLSLHDSKYFQHLIEDGLKNQIDFTIIRYENEILFFVEISKNVIQLIFSTFQKNHLLSACKFFLEFKKDFYLDVSDFYHLFPYTLHYHLFKQANHQKDLPISNQFIKEHLLSNWVSKFINKKGKLFSFQDVLFLANDAKPSKRDYVQEKENENNFLCVLNEPHPQEINYQTLDLLSFCQALQHVSLFQKLNAKKELQDCLTFHGYCLGIVEDNHIIAGACIEKIGSNYMYVSYVFTIDEKAHQGYGKKVLQALENEAFKQDKKIMLICDNPIALSLYQKQNYQIICKMHLPKE